MIPPPRSAKFTLDGRIKLLMLIASCFLCQYVPVALLPVWIIFLLCLFIPEKRRNTTFWIMLRAGLVFIVFWLAMTLGSDLLGGKIWSEAVWAALPLGGRLLALTLTGILYVGCASPVETGKAAAWFLRPVLGNAAWRPALGIALTAWFLPQALRLSGDIRAAMKARGVKLPLRKKAALLVGTALRILEDKADELAVGLASRRLDDSRSWR